MIPPGEGHAALPFFMPFYLPIIRLGPLIAGQSLTPHKSAGGSEQCEGLFTTVGKLKDAATPPPLLSNIQSRQRRQGCHLDHPEQIGLFLCQFEYVRCC